MVSLWAKPWFCRLYSVQANSGATPGRPFVQTDVEFEFLPVNLTGRLFFFLLVSGVTLSKQMQQLSFGVQLEFGW